MTKLRYPVSLETTFGIYTVDEILGEGAAGRVYGGISLDNSPVAVKVLTEAHASTDKRNRFKNEISFLQRTKHANIVAVLDHGIARGEPIVGPFYVMRKYQKSLRELMKPRIAPDAVLPLFSQILDGIEAAHLQDVIHRDLKPENILYDHMTSTLAIADFGIARFTDDILATFVETAPTQRLANFQYAAPEQRAPGNTVSAVADLYALGLILNEMFTGTVPHGTGYQLIASISKELGFLDEVIAKLLRQAPQERPASIAELKTLIQRHRAEAVSAQRISQIDGTIIAATEIDECLALEPPRLVGVDWDRGNLTLILDREVSREWVDALHQMGNYSSVGGTGPGAFSFERDKAFVQAEEFEVQQIINHFKSWLPLATATLKQLLEKEVRRKEGATKERLRQEREAEEQRLRVLKQITI